MLLNRYAVMARRGVTRRAARSPARVQRATLRCRSSFNINEPPHLFCKSIQLLLRRVNHSSPSIHRPPKGGRHASTPKGGNSSCRHSQSFGPVLKGRRRREVSALAMIANHRKKKTFSPVLRALFFTSAKNLTWLVAAMLCLSQLQQRLARKPSFSRMPRSRIFRSMRFPWYR